MYAKPPYETEHTGTAIVIGSGPDCFVEFQEAREHRPAATVIAVNETIRHIKAPHFFTLHVEKMRWFEGLWIEAWGADFAPLVHTQHTKDFDRLYKPGAAWYAWPCARSACSSGWAAAKVAEAMGHEEVILCGVPLEASGYGFQTQDRGAGDPRLGLKPKVADRHFRHLADDLRSGIGKRVRSMSGRTRELLGGPEWQSQT